MAPRVVVIDNYDSFVYNLYQYLGELGADPVVHRHDAIDLAGIRALAANAMPSTAEKEPPLPKCALCDTARSTALCSIACGSASAAKNGSTAAIPPTVDNAITIDSSCNPTICRRCR